MIRIALMAAGKGHDAPLRQRLQFAGIDNPISIPILPDRQVLQFLAGQHAVAVNVEGGEGLIAVVPEQAEGDIDKQLQGHNGAVLSVAFTFDGQTLASGSEDETIRLWDVQTGQPQAILKGDMHWVNSVAFSRDGQTLASA